MTSSVRISANFEQNLESIRCYYLEQDRPERFERLLDLLFDAIVPNLQSFPFVGRDFLKVIPGSLEGLRSLERLTDLLPERASLREYISEDFLVLYLVQDELVTLLAIKHHLQVSFDLKRFYG